MNEQPGSRLIHIEKEKYGKAFGTGLLEQYKLYVQSAESMSARWPASSQYLLTLNAGLAIAIILGAADILAWRQ